MGSTKTALVRARGRLRAAARQDAGYTLVELLAVVAIMAIVSVTVTAGVAVGMRTMISVSGVSVSESMASNAVSDLVENITLASPIIAISPTRLVLLRDLPGRCERHQFVVNTTATKEPRQLQHIIQRYRLQPGNDCASIDASAWTGIPSILNTVVVDNLVANPENKPVFAYIGPGGKPLLLPGDVGYSATSKQYGPCDITRVNITLSARPATQDMVQTIQSSASPRAYSLGLRC